MARSVIALGHGPILDLLGADPAHLVLAVLARRDGTDDSKCSWLRRNLVVRMDVGTIGLRSAGSTAAMSAPPAVVGASAAISTTRWLRLYSSGRHCGVDELRRVRRYLRCWRYDQKKVGADKVQTLVESLTITGSGTVGNRTAPCSHCIE